jgi:HD superfamily phosphodiesterase
MVQLSLSKLFQFVIAVSYRHNIDESHSLGHSMRVLHFAEQIAAEEPLYLTSPSLLEIQKPVIQAAAVLHDTCDKKYRDEQIGLMEIRDFLAPMMSSHQIADTVRIIENMSYSKVTKTGMPDLGNLQTAFNVVREADLMDAYDFDRSMMYHLHKHGKTFEDAHKDATELFERRVFKHAEDGLLFTEYAVRRHPELTRTAMNRMISWRSIMKYR